jgi:phage tail-like protein
MSPRPDPFRGFNFIVEIQKVPVAGFSEVVLPEQRARYLDYREATGKRTQKILVGISYGPLVLRRGIEKGTDLEDWWQLVVSGQPEARPGSIVLLDEQRQAATRWYFTGALPVAYRTSPLNALKNRVVIESLELSVESFRRT